MHDETAVLIEKCFAEHLNDGDFASGDRAPYAVIGPARAGGSVLFGTKPRIISAIVGERKGLAPLGIIARYGLPSRGDLPWIPNLLGSGRMLFLADMDPADLMIFAYLRRCLGATDIVYVGANDRLLEAVHVSRVASVAMPLGPSEQESHDVLRRVFPDFRNAVGRRCARLLERGYKVELDAVASGAKNRAAIARYLAAL